MDIAALRSQIVLLSHDPSLQISDSDVLSTVRTASFKDCKAVLDKIKEKIKDKKKVCPLAKLKLLRLLAVCLRANNEHFVTYMVHRLLPRLAVFARHKKVGEIAASSDQKAASQQFLVTLLDCLATWSRQLGEKYAEFREVYGDLLLDGVVFPMAEESLSVRSQRGHSAEDIIESLRKQLNSANPNVVEMTEDAETLQKLLSDVQQRVTYCRDENARRSLLELNDRIVGVLRLVDDFRAQGMMQRSGMALMRKAEGQWRRVEEPKSVSRPADEDLDDECDIAQERKFASLKKRRHVAYASMRQSIVQRFQQFVTRIQSIQRKVDTLTILEQTVADLEQRLSHAKDERNDFQSRLVASQQRVSELERELQRLKPGLGNGGKKDLPAQAPLRMTVHANFAESCMEKEALLYENAQFSVKFAMEVNGNVAELELTVGNSTTESMEMVELEAESREPGLSVLLDEIRISRSISPGDHCSQRLKAICTAPYLDVPELFIRYAAADKSFRHRLPLPIPLMRFLRSSAKSCEEVLALSQSLPCTESTFPFLPDLSSIRALSITINLKGYLRSFLCGGGLVAVGTVLDFIVVVKIEGVEGGVRLKCYSRDSAVRVAVTQTLQTILEAKEDSSIRT